VSACQECGATLTEVCMACRGRKGGAAKTRKKRAASRANWTKAETALGPRWKRARRKRPV
jgi:hypothetical protein